MRYKWFCDYLQTVIDNSEEKVEIIVTQYRLCNLLMYSEWVICVTGSRQLTTSNLAKRIKPNRGSEHSRMKLLPSDGKLDLQSQLIIGAFLE